MDGCLRARKGTDTARAGERRRRAHARSLFVLAAYGYMRSRCGVSACSDAGSGGGDNLWRAHH